MPVWLVDCTELFDREGLPYSQPPGTSLAGQRRTLPPFCAVAAEWPAPNPHSSGAQLVHCNDWQSGLVPVLLAPGARPALVFTIHNMAYQGLFPAATFHELDCPADLWHYEALEFHGQMSFIKGGLVYADASPRSAPTMPGKSRRPPSALDWTACCATAHRRLQGILNGIDTREWNPQLDPHIKRAYSAENLRGKSADKADLQRIMGLDVVRTRPLFGFVGRLVEQKGVDLIVNALPDLLAEGGQLALLGSGEKHYEQTLVALAERYPGQVAVRLGYDEALAHGIEAGADLFLMPSRFEPCGLNQMYSLTYGTIPVVHRTGGLADTVIDVTEASLEDGTANGFVFDHLNADGLGYGVRRACAHLPASGPVEASSTQRHGHGFFLEPAAPVAYGVLL